MKVISIFHLGTMKKAGWIQKISRYFTLSSGNFDLSVVVYILGTFNECRHSDDINDPNEQEQPGDHHNQGFIYLRPRMCV